MLRATILILCLILAAAAAGRYQAEVRVKQTRQVLQDIKQQQLSERRSIQLLRAEIAYLESPERLAVVAEKVTRLKPLSGRQLLSAEEFAVALGDDRSLDGSRAGALDIIKQPIAMADTAPAR